MWKNIRKRWDHLFDQEQEQDEIKQEEKTAMSKKLETKMAYQYPKHQRKIETDRPNSHIKKLEKQTKTIEKEKTEKKEANPPLPKAETRREPFKVREVPSPIYGFQDRRKKRTDTPQLFIKEKEREREPQKEEAVIVPKETELTSVKKDEYTKQPVSETNNKLSVEQEVQEDQTVLEERDQTQSEEEILQTPVMLTEEPVVAEADSMTSDSKPVSDKAVDIKKIVQSEQLNRPDKRSKRPVNVMMTPRDKWKIQQKKAQEHPVTIENKQPTAVADKQEITIPYSVPMHLLDDVEEQKLNQTAWVQEQSETLQNTLRYFNIKAKVVDVTQGPSVTRFEIQPEPGVKVSKIKNLTDDIKMNLAAKDIRMEAPIPGKHTIGIEVPNANPEAVFLHKLLDSDQFTNQESSLTVALGADIEGRPVFTDLKKMPHGLIAGATGSGKSVCINTILISLLYKANHEDVRFLLIDPKMVELTPYNEIPHLVAPVITDVKAATSALKWAVQEMEDRYQKFVEAGTRDIQRYNQKMLEQNQPEQKMPFIVIVIDELADLMMTAPQDVEDAICRIAQKARACGIHLLIATQRPSVDVITGLIKANVPTRVAFSVSSQIDSRTILDTNGAEKLLGKGDMLFVENGSSEIKRIQGAFVSDDEIERVTNYVKQLAKPNYLFEQEQLIQQSYANEELDDLYDEAVDFVMEYNGASASLLQRRFKIGYNRAARLIDSMEDNGIVSGQNGSKQREVLVTGHDRID
ncbi:DNA translocase FtsK [Gracilibacillus alcaliphilus]|uniref:DNA translocase FtsK n=1 Tax=Gracilibacillus alcaliphilus TaxID=1401441 RepID=UPI00195AC1D9|nr:DNA translocase FtsK [Gracilibacillus alcaliphilus]MBM7679467.1 S-DNA-T family DNA segregation ATPase FtsK/SpoIIIE [Gracilibacillus alcaliphilus]